MSIEENMSEIDMLAGDLEKDLLGHYGPVLGGDELRRALGYRSMDAFRQAMVRNTVPVQLFSIENRRGKFALVKDIAHWLASRRLCAS